MYLGSGTERRAVPRVTYAALLCTVRHSRHAAESRVTDAVVRHCCLSTAPHGTCK